MYPFAEEALAPMFSYYTVQAPKHLITGLGRLFYSYEKADTCTFIVVMHDLIDKKHRYPHNPDHDHTGSITSIAVCEQQQTFLSASIDTSIKVWDLNNQLVRTVILNTIPTGLAFGNNKGDLLLTVKNEIRKINHKDYMPSDYLRHMIGVQFPTEISERPVPKSRGAKETMSDLESTLPSGIRQNRDQIGYVPLAQLRERCKQETIKKAEIAKLQQRNYELEMLSQGKYEGKKCIRKTQTAPNLAITKEKTRTNLTQTKQVSNVDKLFYTPTPTSNVQGSGVESERGVTERMRSDPSL
jgi:WD40 repeat protein